MPSVGDPGADGTGTSVVGKDVFAYNLGYFDGDFTPINNSVTLSESRDKLWTRSLENIQHSGLYNGNISWMTTDLRKIGQAKGDANKSMQAMMYRYDQLHRITKSRSLTNYNPTAGFAARGTHSAYDEDYSYDANGNILTLNRNDETAALKDDFNYTYYDSTNRLKQHKVSGGQYQYDAIGNLVNDQEEGTVISWTPYGKVRTVIKGDSVTVNYRYDATGNRIEKRLVKGGKFTVTNYLRDASGNVMAIYNDSTMTEAPIYGSTRVGQYSGGRMEGYRTLGERKYELSNHLGNVLTVITDNVGMKTDSVWATVASVNDYYPFGLEMKGREFSDTTYRYGFNGKEKDGSFASTSGYDYGFRIYSPKIAKFLTVDPLERSYAWYTPYQFAGNTPIQAMDLDGGEPDYTKAKYNVGTNEYNEPTIRVEGVISIKIRIINLSSQILNKSQIALNSKTIMETALNKVRQNYYPIGDLGGNAYSSDGDLLQKIIQYRYETNVTYNIEYTYGETLNDIQHDEWALLIVDNIPKRKDGFDPAGVASDIGGRIALVEVSHASSSTLTPHEELHDMGAEDDYTIVKGQAVNNSGEPNIMQPGSAVDLKRKSKREIDSNIIGRRGALNYIKKKTGNLYTSHAKDEAKQILETSGATYDKKKED